MTVLLNRVSPAITKSALALLAVTTLMAAQCLTGDPQSGLRLNDAIAPEITVSTHTDGDSYRPTVALGGTITDTADAAGTAGEITSAAYALTGTSVSGEIMVAEDGGFEATFSTAGITGTITVELTATDWNGNTRTETLTLNAPKEITSFAFLAADNAALEEDAVGTIDGTDITVPVPDGTDVRSLIARFEIAGQEARVGVTVQESGVTENDFSQAVAYTVEANDGSTTTYTVTVVGAATVAATALGNGSVTLSPEGPYSIGDSVTATAVPQTNAVFNAWSGDITGSNNPTTFVVAGNTEFAAEFWAPDVAVIPGSPYDLGEADEGESTTTTTFTIENVGELDLEITSVTIDDAASFTLTDNTASPLTSGVTTTFDVAFNAPSPGLFETLVRIGTNDPDTPEYQLTVTGKGVNVWTVEQTLTNPSEAAYDAVFAFSGNHIFAVSNEDSVWSWEDGSPDWTLAASTETDDFLVGPVAVTVAPDDSLVAVVGDQKSINLFTWDGSSLTASETLTPSFTQSAQDVQFSPDGSLLAQPFDNGTILIWEWDSDTSTWVESHELTGHTVSVRSVAFAPDGNTIISSAPNDVARIWTWNGTSWSNTSNPTGTAGMDAVFSSDGTRIAAASGSEIHVWEWNESDSVWESAHTLTGHTDSVIGVAFSADHDLIASASFDYDIRIWDYDPDSTSWINTQTLTNHTDAVHSVAFDPDDLRLVSASSDQSVIVWE